MSDIYSIMVKKRLKILEEQKVEDIEKYDKYEVVYQSPDKLRALTMFQNMRPNHDDPIWRELGVYIGTGPLNRWVSDRFIECNDSIISKHVGHQGY